MRLADVPLYPAYLVFHDAFDNGAMEVYPADSIAEAEDEAQRRQLRLDATGNEECGFWRAYEKLPRRRVYKFHPQEGSMKQLRRSIARKMFDVAAIIMPVSKGIAEGHHDEPRNHDRRD